MPCRCVPDYNAMHRSALPGLPVSDTGGHSADLRPAASNASLASSRRLVYRYCWQGASSSRRKRGRRGEEAASNRRRSAAAVAAAALGVRIGRGWARGAAAAAANAILSLRTPSRDTLDPGMPMSVCVCVYTLRAQLVCPSAVLEPHIVGSTPDLRDLCVCGFVAIRMGVTSRGG